MVKKSRTNKRDILYIGGGFDVLHNNHRKFILRGIRLFSKKYNSKPSKIIFGLKDDKLLNKEKGKFRPFFSFDWRKQDLLNFLKKKRFILRVIKTKNVLCLDSKKTVIQTINPLGEKNLKKKGFDILHVKPYNNINTTNIEAKLLQNKDKSNCKIRKVGALLLRNGKIISESYSGKGDCNNCEKYNAYEKGGGKLSKKIPCRLPHAEEICLKKAKEGDDLIITCSPCMSCAIKIAQKKIKRIVFLDEYYDRAPLRYLRKKGVQLRKAGINHKG